MSKSSIAIEKRQFKQGKFVFREKETGQTAFLINEGEVEILKIVDDREIILGVVGKGGMFGEMALISNKPRMASVRVSKDATLMIITQGMFQSRLDKLDPFSRALIEVLSDHIRTVANKLGVEIRAS